MQAVESWPYIGGVLAVGFLFGFALVTPMSSRLLKESVMSVGLGMGLAGLYPYYYKRIYLTNVCTVYDDLRKAIKLNPALAKPDDASAVNKNFGPSKWNPESSLESEDEVEMDDEMSIFAGHADDDRKMLKAQMMEAA